MENTGTTECNACGRENNASATCCTGCGATFISAVASDTKSGSYSIYERKPNEGNREFQAVKNGFSWPAFFFGPLWFWAYKMFFVGFAELIGFYIIDKIMLVQSRITGEYAYYLVFVIGWIFLVGLLGNPLRKVSLKNKGYKLTQPNEPGTSPVDAILIYEKKEGIVTEEVSPIDTSEQVSK